MAQKYTASPRGPARVRSERFNLSNTVGVAIIGLLVSLVGTGIASMISLYARQATLTEQVTNVASTLAKHLDHSVDRDEYLRRDAEIQKAIEKMATKDELRDVTQTLRDIQTTLQAGTPAARRAAR
jgi:CHASE1-domain containing sensor protein